MTISRGGVEDTRLEAKDIQKIRGQGQLFRGQTLLRPRTGMLEAKAKDQGHKRKCSPKKKVFKKFFQAISKKILQKFFLALSSKNRLLKFFFKQSTKFQQFKKKYCPRAENRAIFEDLRPRGQDQGLQNVSSRPRTSSRTPPLTISI